MKKSLASRSAQSVRAGRRRSRALILAALALVGLTLGAAPAAFADDTAALTATPSSISVGDTATVTAAGLGGLSTAVFGLDGTPGGGFVESGGTTYSAAVSSGAATATFTATAAGTFTVTVGNGETPLATTTITVTAAQPSAAATVTATPSSITVGETTTIKGANLGALQSAVFGLDDTGGGSFSGGSSSVTVPVVNGGATTIFTADRVGTFTIAVSDGETTLATTVVTVAAAASPTPTTTPTVTPTPTPTPIPEPSGGSNVWLWIVIGLLAISAVAIVSVVVARRRGRRTETGRVDPTE